MEINEILKSKAIEGLKLSNEKVEAIRKQIVNQAGQAGRNRTDKEEWFLERMEKAQSFIGKALFELQRADFNVEQEIPELIHVSQ